ncbi:hypothetical protein ABHI18_004575 [Aspergillus niger]
MASTHSQQGSRTVFELHSLKVYGNCIPVISLIGIHEERISYGNPKAGNALSWILKMSSNIRIEPRMMYVWTHWNN